MGKGEEDEGKESRGRGRVFRLGETQASSPCRSSCVRCRCSSLASPRARVVGAVIDVNSMLGRVREETSEDGLFLTSSALELCVGRDGSGRCHNLCPCEHRRIVEENSRRGVEIVGGFPISDMTRGDDLK